MTKSASNPVFIFILGALVMGGIIYGVNYSKENDQTKREQLFLEAQRILETEENTELKKTDYLAKEGIERVFYQDAGKLRDMGLVFDANVSPDYKDLIIQMDYMKERYSRETVKSSIIEAFGYDYGIEIWYILENYDEWREYNGMRK